LLDFSQSVILLGFSYDKETSFAHFGGETMKEGVCLFGLILNINSVSLKLLTAP